MTLSRVWAVYKRHAYSLKHSAPGFVDMLFWPAMDLMLWGLLTLFIQRQQIHLPVAIYSLIGGVLLWDIVFRSNLGIGVTFLDDTSWTHNVLNLLVSPLRPSEYVAGAVAWSISKVLAGHAAPWGKLGVALVFDGVYLFGGMAFARSMFGVLRRRGYVTRYME